MCHQSPENSQFSSRCDLQAVRLQALPPTSVDLFTDVYQRLNALRARNVARLQHGDVGDGQWRHHSGFRAWRRRRATYGPSQAWRELDSISRRPRHRSSPKPEGPRVVHI